MADEKEFTKAYAQDVKARFEKLEAYIKALKDKLEQHGINAPEFK